MKFYLNCLSLTIFFVLIITLASAQEQSDFNLNRLVHIGMEQGLSSDKVNCIFQDKKGFIWIGTDYGLNQYDGYYFKVFTKINDDSSSLTDNDIKCLTQDAAGNIWIGTTHGLNVMNYETGKIARFVSKNKSDTIWKHDISITALASDDSSVWIGTESNGLIEYKIFQKQIK